MESYCLFCKSGQESLVIDLLKHSGFAAFAPYAIRNKCDGYGVRRTKARLLPGYVFFDAEDEPDWDAIRRWSAVLKVLRYEDGACALRGDDLAFVKWLKQYEGMVDVSQVVKVGTKIFRATQVHVTNFILLKIRFRQNQNSNAKRQRIFNGGLSCVKKRNQS